MVILVYFPLNLLHVAEYLLNFPYKHMHVSMHVSFLTYSVVSQNPEALEWIYHPYQMEYPIQQYLEWWVQDQYSTQCEDS